MKTNNEAVAKAAQFEASNANMKLAAAERQGSDAKAAVRAAKAVFKKAKKSLKLARKKAKSARKLIMQWREATTKTETKLQKMQKKIAQSRQSAKAKAQAAAKRTRPAEGPAKKISAMKDIISSTATIGRAHSVAPRALPDETAAVSDSDTNSSSVG